VKNKYLPQLYGVVKDFHPRMIPENKVADCDNVIFQQGRVRRRYGYAPLGPTHLNGVINGITYYEQVRLGDKWTLVWTSRDAYLYDTTTGSFTTISSTYNTGTARVNSLAVTGVGSTWIPASWTLLDRYTIKFGTNNASTTAVNFTGTVQRNTSFSARANNLSSSCSLDSTTTLELYSNASGYLCGRIITLSGSTTTIGTERVLVSSAITYHNVSKISSTLAIACYYYSGAYYSVILTISGTSITPGTSYSYYTSAYEGYMTVVVLSSTLAVASGFTWSTYYSPRLYPLGISGSTITPGTAFVISGGAMTAKLGVVVNSSSVITVCRTSSGGSLYFYNLSVTSSTITQNYYSTIPIPAYSMYRIDSLCFAHASSGTGLIMVGIVATTYYPVCVYIVDSGSTFSISTRLDITSINCQNHHNELLYIDSTHFLFVENGETINARMIMLSTSTHAISIEYTQEIKVMGTLYSTQCVCGSMLSSTGALFFYNDGSSSYYGNAVPLVLDVVANTISIMSFILSSISSLSNLYVGLQLTATFLSVGTRIKSIDWSGSTITIDMAATGNATAGSISADISTWYTIHSVDSATGITLLATNTTTGNTTNTSAIITNIPNTAILHVGMGISGTGIPSNSSILTIDSATQITISNNATATNTGVTLSMGLCITSSHEVNYIMTLCFNGTDDDYWSFAYPYLTSVGDKILVASNGVDPIMKWTGTGSISTFGSTGVPTTAKYIGYFGAAMYEHFLAAWTTDGGTNMPQTLEIATAGAPETWSGCYYDFLQKNDEIIGMQILKNRLIIYKNKSISMAYPTPEGGNTDPFDMEQDVIIDIEIPVGRTVVNFGDYHMFLGLDNVYKFDGLSLMPIGTEIINTMKNEWNGAYMSHAFAFTIPNENLYCIFIPTLEIRDVNNNVTKAESQYPDKAYCFNYVENTWTIWTFAINPTTLVSQQFTCAAFVNKLYAPTVADIDALNRTYNDMNMRWVDLIAYSNVQSLLLGDNNGYVYEMRDTYNDDNGTVIDASFTTRDYPLNDPVHVFMLLEAVLGMTERLVGDIQIRASADFGETWSNWINVDQAGGASYVEYIANFMHKGLQVRFEVANVAGADFEVESIMIGFNDELGHKK